MFSKIYVTVNSVCIAFVVAPNIKQHFMTKLIHTYNIKCFAIRGKNINTIWFHIYFLKTYNFTLGASLCHTNVIFQRTLERLLANNWKYSQAIHWTIQQQHTIIRKHVLTINLHTLTWFSIIKNKLKVCYEDNVCAAICLFFSANFHNSKPLWISWLWKRAKNKR